MLDQLSAEVELTAVLNPVYFGEYAALTRALYKAFQERRVKIKPVNTTMAEWIEASQQGSVDVTVGRWAADYPDADSFVYILHSQEGSIGKFVDSPEIDHLIERGRAETSPTVRHSLYRQIEEIIERDALMLPLFHDQEYRFARPEVDGLSLSYGAPAVDYANLRIQG
jgi:ABC-type oligopeptide transport system substrate-binding subunit